MFSLFSGEWGQARSEREARVGGRRVSRSSLVSRLPSLVRNREKNEKGCSAGYTVSCITCLRQGTLRADREALATVTGIVDGTGSVGAAIGQVYFDATRLFRKKETGPS